ncbi:rano class II histocompatibility antigen, A beta chain-like [Pholidichthys leucotaenia]
MAQSVTLDGGPVYGVHDPEYKKGDHTVRKVNWTRDGQEVTSDVSSAEVIENGDWYFQIHSHLELTPRTDTCRTDTDLSMPESERSISDVTKIAGGASGLVLGLVLLLAGLIYY